MKSIIVAAVALSLVGCSHSERRRQTQLMDEIESRIDLPEGAHSLTEYARLYAWDETGRIIGRYIIPLRKLPKNAECSELDENFTMRPVPCPTFPEVEWDQVRAGERRWLTESELPVIADGGCSVVDMVFDVENRTFERVSCNGLG